MFDSREELEATLQKFSKFFDPKKLFQKVLRFSGPIGEEATRKILQMYYVLQDPGVPAKAKAIIIGALGYVICPFDLVPDFIPGAGLLDDIAAVTAAFVAVSMHVDDSVNRKVDEKMAQLLGGGDNEAEEKEAPSDDDQPQ
ncbi:MAG: DUF1232 domain-containing protein [Mailhella sp.]|nr:DUF1232 domain-containing protein [Mailhella sp.]